MTNRKNRGGGMDFLTGSYVSWGAAQLNRIELPKEIKCSSCRRPKAPTAFSAKAQMDVRQTIIANGGRAARDALKIDVRCMACTRQKELLEMYCIHCKEHKGLEHFSKTQRRTPDEAMCYMCTEEREKFRAEDELAKTNPDERGSALDENDEDDHLFDSDLDEDDDYDDDYSTVTGTETTDDSESSVAGGVSLMSINESTQSSVMSSNFAASLFSSAVSSSRAGDSASGWSTVGGPGQPRLRNAPSAASTTTASQVPSSRARFPRISNSKTSQAESGVSDRQTGQKAHVEDDDSDDEVYDSDSDDDD